MGCVPTIFADLLRYADANRIDLSSLKNAACGGSAVPRQLMRDYEERHDVGVFQAWGMTETSPVATYSRPDEASGHDEIYWDYARQAGQAPALGTGPADGRRGCRGTVGWRVHR